MVSGRYLRDEASLKCVNLTPESSVMSEKAFRGASAGVASSPAGADSASDPVAAGSAEPPALRVPLERPHPPATRRRTRAPHPSLIRPRSHRDRALGGSGLASC